MKYSDFVNVPAFWDALGLDTGGWIPDIYTVQSKIDALPSADQDALHEKFGRVKA